MVSCRILNVMMPGSCFMVLGLGWEGKGVMNWGCVHGDNYWGWVVGFPGDSVVKKPPANAGDMGLIPGLGRFPGEGNGNPLQYSCLENPKDRGPRKATIHRVAESDTT